MATHFIMLAWRNPTDGGAWQATVHGVTKSQTQLSMHAHTHTRTSTHTHTHIYICVCINIFISKKAMAPHSSTLAWRIARTEEPGRLQSMRSLRVRYN